MCLIWPLPLFVNCQQEAFICCSLTVENKFPFWLLLNFTHWPFKCQYMSFSELVPHLQSWLSVLFSFIFHEDTQPAVNLVFSVCPIGCHIFQQQMGRPFMYLLFIYYCQFLKCASANSSNPDTIRFRFLVEVWGKRLPKVQSILLAALLFARKSQRNNFKILMWVEN